MVKLDLARFYRFLYSSRGKTEREDLTKVVQLVFYLNKLYLDDAIRLKFAIILRKRLYSE